MKNKFIELDRLIRVWDGQQANPLTSGQRSVLVEIGRREEDGIPTKISDLVQKIHFGTGPTVHAYLLRLEADQLISKEVSGNDARAVCLALTAAGRDYLKALDNLLQAACR